MTDQQQAWQQRLSVLASEHRLRQFAIADSLVLGIEQFGATATYDYAEIVFPQYTRATFQSWVTVAKHFPASTRIESEWLTFKHYQVAQGAEKDPWLNNAESSELQIARELVWLRKADDNKMSASILRESIYHAYKLRHEAFLEDHPEPEPDPIPEPKPKKKDCCSSEIKELKTPWLPKRARFHLDELARARRVTTEQLLNRIIQDFLDAHCDEIGDAEAAAKKRQAEVWAQMDAASSTNFALHYHEAYRENAARDEQKRREEFLSDALASEVQIMEVLCPE
jgi:hypothetical protein